MIFGFFLPWTVYALVLALHVLLPARHVDGYVRHEITGARLRYRLNGLLVLAAVAVLWAAACRWGGLPWDALWIHRWESLAGAFVIGLAFTAALVLSAPRVRGLAADLYLGRRANPQAQGGRVDAKMYLYMIGAILLELNVLSFLAHHLLSNGAAWSPGMVIHVLMFSFFVCEYLFFEEVHLYTYDFVAERVGFKLGWGCMAFYPYFYAVGMWSEAPKPNPGTPPWALVGCVALFLTGWALSRGANLQKFYFKTRPQQRFLGLVAPEVLTDGERSLLCNGFWGLSRHINYLGEVLMALGLTLSLGRPLDPWPWLYPFYYVVLLSARQRDDDRRCEARYGALWRDYCKRVRWRIVPGLY